MYVLSFFFFSSRRRHTRSKRDWSSDVCSSDLRGSGRGAPLAGRSRRSSRSASCTGARLAVWAVPSTGSPSGRRGDLVWDARSAIPPWVGASSVQVTGGSRSSSPQSQRAPPPAPPIEPAGHSPDTPITYIHTYDSLEEIYIYMSTSICIYLLPLYVYRAPSGCTE